MVTESVTRTAKAGDVLSVKTTSNGWVQIDDNAWIAASQVQ